MWHQLWGSTPKFLFFFQLTGKYQTNFYLSGQWFVSSGNISHHPFWQINIKPKFQPFWTLGAELTKILDLRFEFASTYFIYRISLWNQQAWLLVWNNLRIKLQLISLQIYTKIPTQELMKWISNMDMKFTFVTICVNKIHISNYFTLHIIKSLNAH